MEQNNSNTFSDPDNLYIYSLRKMAESNINKNLTNLTNLLNLRAFLYKADDLIRYSNEKYAIIVMDIAGFKLINEFCSRKTGDELLVYISDCLREYESDKTAVSHFRADIFALCTPYEKKKELIEIVNHLSDRIRAFPIACKVMPAFGICTAYDKTLSASCIQDYAFMAQKTVKGKYFINYAFFDKTMHDKLKLEKRIENAFDEAIESDQFQLYIQPKVDMQTGRIIGGEALVRWIHPEYGFISPGEFVPVLEKNASVIEMDKFIWKKVFQFISRLKQQDNLELPVSINVSRLHAYDETLVKTLLDFSENYSVNPRLVPLELTESAYSENEELMYQKINSLKEHGFLFSMDDFGSGYSTMNMLVTQPVDEVKIDRAFLFHIENPKSQTLVRHSIAMLHELGLSIVVEGVENENQKDFLINSGCRCAQGFLFYKPMPAESFRQLLTSQK